MLALVAATWVPSLASASDLQGKVRVRAGTLSFNQSNNAGHPTISLNGRIVVKREAFSLSPGGATQVGPWDVVLVMNNSGGTGCPAQFFFIAVDSSAKTVVTPEFGTCSDLAKMTNSGSKVVVTMPKMGGRGNQSYVFENGIVLENGKPIQVDVRSEGEISINGRGQVLVSGTPNPRQLRCVEDRVARERHFRDGWDDAILDACAKSVRKP